MPWIPVNLIFILGSLQLLQKKITRAKKLDYEYKKFRTAYYQQHRIMIHRN